MREMFLKYYPLAAISVFGFFIVFAASLPLETDYSTVTAAQTWLQGERGYSEQTFCLIGFDHAFIDNTWVWTLGLGGVVSVIPFLVLQPMIGAGGVLAVASAIWMAGMLSMVYRIARIRGFASTDALFVLLAFALASPVFFIVSVVRDHHYYHLLALFLGIALILEYFTRRRWWLMGVIAGSLVHVRMTAALIMVWPMFHLLFVEQGVRSLREVRAFLRSHWRSIVHYGTPVAFSVIVLLLFNQWRFHNAFESGFGVAQVFESNLEAMRAAHGLLHPAYIPSNVYWYFLSMPTPVLQEGTALLKAPWLTPSLFGMSVFLTSIPFLRLFYYSTVSQIERWVTVMVIGTIFLVLLMFYSSGAYQHGMRYTSDVMPLILLLYLQSFPNQRVPASHYFVIALAMCVNIFLQLLFME
jgi:hypothetical protein